MGFGWQCAAIQFPAKDLFRLQAEEYVAVEARLAKIEPKLMRWHRDDDVSRRIATIPGAAGDVQVRPRLCRLARTDTQGSFDGRPAKIWRNHKGRRLNAPIDAVSVTAR